MKIQIPMMLIMTTILMIVSGCGESPEHPTGSVSGKVSVNGESMTGATVQFYNSTTGSGLACILESDGSFQSARPIPTGEYTVYIGPSPSEHPVGSKGLPEIPKVPEVVPEKYLTFTSSDLKVTITEGDNSLSIDLK